VGVRVQSAEHDQGGWAGNPGTVALTLTGVTQGNQLIYFATSNNNSAISAADNAGGVYTTADALNSGGSQNYSLLQGTATVPNGGNVTITFSAASTYRMACIVAEIMAGYTLDQHSISAPFVAGNTYTIAATTTGADYCFSCTLDQGGQGGVPTISGQFTAIGDSDSILALNDAEYQQSSSGTATASWAGFGSATLSKPAGGIMTFLPPVVTTGVRLLGLLGCGT